MTGELLLKKLTQHINPNGAFQAAIPNTYRNEEEHNILIKTCEVNTEIKNLFTTAHEPSENENGIDGLNKIFEGEAGQLLFDTSFNLSARFFLFKPFQAVGDTALENPSRFHLSKPVHPAGDLETKSTLKNNDDNSITICGCSFL